MTHNHTELIDDGVARKIEFSMSMKRVDDYTAAIYGELKTQATSCSHLLGAGSEGWQGDNVYGALSPCVYAHARWRGNYAEF